VRKVKTGELDVASRAKARKGMHHVENGMKKKKGKKNKKNKNGRQVRISQGGDRHHEKVRRPDRSGTRFQVIF